MKASILFVQFYQTAPRYPFASKWIYRQILQLKKDPRIIDLYEQEIDDTPIDMCRNRAVEIAKELKVDFLVTVDDDNAPDLYTGWHPKLKAIHGVDPKARPFMETALNLAFRHAAPGCVIGAPYCGPPPVENVFVFRWANWSSQDHNDNQIRLEQFTREEAAIRTGVEKVAALPTGVILYDMRVWGLLDPPYHEYEHADTHWSKKGSTEDVVVTRNLDLVGVPQYCLWDCWAGHWKPKCVGKPILATVEDVRGSLRRALVSGRRDGEKLMMVGDGAAPPPPVAAVPEPLQAHMAGAAEGNGHAKKVAKKPAKR